MIVLFVSECKKSAWKRSRRILSRYAVQIGRRTWLARMSREGLENVRKELLSGVSRQMSVACHRVRGRYGTELVWIVGTRRHFSADGEFAFSHTKRPVIKTLNEKTPLQRLLNYLVVLAGLFHDVGKQIRAFQKKLRDASINQSDPVRHERVSVIFFLALLEEILPDSNLEKSQNLQKKKKSGLQLSRRKKLQNLSGSKAPAQRGGRSGKVRYLTDDASWLKPFKTAEDLEGALDTVWENGLAHYRKYIPAVDENSKNAPLTPNWHMGGKGSGMPILLTSMIYLLVSHHKMPKGDEDYYPLESNYTEVSQFFAAVVAGRRPMKNYFYNNSR